MRDGNIFGAEAAVVLPKVFELPMRDGNTVDHLTPKYTASFLNFLWGMETFFCSQQGSLRCKFLNFLWGMETARGQPIACGWSKFLNFLWGMETLLARLLLAVFYPRFWTSYEGWKHGFGSGPTIHEPCFWTSYEGWKHAGILFADGTWLVFELPMRDGNASQTFNPKAIIMRFWTSYEGWKQELLGFFYVVKGSFWTSYEGWKRISRWFDGSFHRCFWTSYEGWKRTYSGLNVASRSRVFELPMRDGNLSTSRLRWVVQ